MDQAAEPSDSGSVSLVVQEAVDKFRASLTRPQREKFKNCDLNAVKSAVKEVEDTLGSLRTNPRMHRARRFIEGMSHLSKVVELFLNVSEVIAFIWGPIKFVLVTASALFEALDALLDTYSKVGEILPNLADFQRKFRQHPGVLVVLERYLCLVLELHSKVLQVFGRPVWKQVFSASWLTFKSDFGPILGDLKTTRERLNEEKLTSAVVEIQSLRAEVKDSSLAVLQQMEKNVEDDRKRQKAQAEEQRQFRLQSVLMKLGSPKVIEDQEVAAGRGEFGGSGTWLLQLPVFKDWLDPRNFHAPPVIFLNGIPGAGKTVLVSRIIEFLQRRKKKDTCVTYFYFKHSSPEKRTIKSMLAALLSQIVLSDDVVLQHAYQALAGHSPLEQPEFTILKELAMTALQSQRICYVILDGLDECGDPGERTNKDAERILHFFGELLSPPLTPADESTPASLRLLFSGQRDGFWEAELASLPRMQPIRLDSEGGHNNDIRDFCFDMAYKLLGVFQGPEVKAAVTDAIVTQRKVEKRAKGMFLFARVFLDNLMEQECEEDVLTELKDDIFPSELDDAYGRVALRVLGKGQKPRQKAAKQILGWICCARRELLWREIQTRRCIDLEAETCRSQSAYGRSCKQICGSLVDMLVAKSGGDEIAKLVHETAREYLIKKGHVSMMREHTDMAIFCARYLTSPAFKLGLSEQHQRPFALQGYYGFQEYAAAYWSAEYFSEYSVDPAPTPKDPEGIDVKISKLILDLPTDPITRHSRFNFHSRIEPRRRLIKRLLLEDVGNAESLILQRFYGPFRFKCPRPWCGWFHTGFNEEIELKQHVDEHERPFKCPDEACLGSDVSFVKNVELQRHADRYHTPEDRNVTIPLASKQLPPLWKAAEDGDLVTVKQLVALGADPNSTSKPSGGRSALILAIMNHHYKVCEFLLTSGADVNFGVSNHTVYALVPLHLAVDVDDIDIVRLLLSSSQVDRNSVLHGHKFLRTPINQIGVIKTRPVDLAAFMGRAEILKLLASSDNANQTTGQRGLLPLHFACMGTANLACVSFLLAITENIDEKDNDERTPLSHAVNHEPPKTDWRLRPVLVCAELDVVQALLNAGADPASADAAKRSVLSFAAQAASSPVISLLIEAGATNYLDKDATGNSPLHYAVLAGNVGAIQVLIAKGAADPKNLADGDISRLYNNAQKSNNAHGIVDLLHDSGVPFPDVSHQDTGPVIMKAINDGDLEILSKLLQQGKHIEDCRDSEGKNAVAVAAIKGDVAIAKALLIASDFDLNSGDDEGRSASMHAAMRGHAGVMRVLLDAGDVDVNAHDKTGMTAILYAAKSGNVDVVQLLVGCEGIDVNARDKAGMTAILYAAKNGNVDVVQLLVGCEGIDVNVRDNHGRSSVVYAAQHSNAGTMLALLAEESINVNTPDSSGKCALAYAAGEGFVKVMQALFDHGRVEVDALDAAGKTVLSYAAESGRTAVVELLLNAGATWHASEDKKGYSALYYAVLGGNVAILNRLLRTKIFNLAKTDKEGRGLPYAAVKSNSLDMLRKVLALGLENYYEPDVYGWTLLHHCMVDLTLPRLEELLSHPEIDVNASTTGYWPRFAFVKVGSTVMTMESSSSSWALQTSEPYVKILETGRVKMQSGNLLGGRSVAFETYESISWFCTQCWESGYRPNLMEMAIQQKDLAIGFLELDAIHEVIRDLSEEELTSIFRRLGVKKRFPAAAGKTLLQKHLPVLMSKNRKLVLRLFKWNPKWVVLEGELAARVRERLCLLKDDELWKVCERAGLKREPEEGDDGENGEDEEDREEVDDGEEEDEEEEQNGEEEEDGEEGGF